MFRAQKEKTATAMGGRWLARVFSLSNFSFFFFCCFVVGSHFVLLFDTIGILVFATSTAYLVRVHLGAFFFYLALEPYVAVLIGRQSGDLWKPLDQADALCAIPWVGRTFSLAVLLRDPPGVCPRGWRQRLDSFFLIRSLASGGRFARNLQKKCGVSSRDFVSRWQFGLV